MSTAEVLDPDPIARSIGVRAPAPDAPARFVKTPKQRELVEAMLDHEIVMAEGGARSGKTVGIIRQQIVRGMARPSRHLAGRFRAKHAKASLWLETIPFVFARCFPGIPYEANSSDGLIYFPTKHGERSELWVAGFDDQARMEKILGKAFSDVFTNECSQIPYPVIPLLQTRLAESSGLPLRFFADQNPPSKAWWTWKLFHQLTTPDGERVDWDVAVVRMNPEDNAANLPAATLTILRALPKRQRQRFYEGLYTDDVEGALWSDSMVNDALGREPGETILTVVAVDPSVSKSDTSDECGIVVCSSDANGGGSVDLDASGKLSTQTWAKRVVSVYHETKANCVVAEVNNGGDLVEDVIHNVDRNVPVVKVHAAKSKKARAEPIAQLFEQGKVSLIARFPELEEELTTYVPRDSAVSPNRLDAMVWGLTYLLVDQGGEFLYDIIG